jgi:hypothetical protein
MDRRGGVPGAGPWLGTALQVFCLGLALTVSTPAVAQFHVTQPDVVKGEATLGDHAAAYSGPGSAERLLQGHEVEATYGITERFDLIAKGIFQEEIGAALEAKNSQFGGQYELVQREGEGLGFAFRTLYEIAAESGTADDILYGPIGRLVLGKNSATVDAFFLTQVGEDADPGSTELKLNWQVRRDLGPKFGAGVEGYTDIKDLAQAGSFEDQLHRLGPVLYFDFGGRDAKERLDRSPRPLPEDSRRPVASSLQVAAGLLFGLTEATSDLTYKLDVTAQF